MPVSLSTIAAKDGAAATVVGGLLAMDKSGAGTGPWSLAHVLVDGVAGTNLAQVTATNALKVDGSAVTQPVSLTSTTITGTVAGTVADNANVVEGALADAAVVAGAAGSISAKLRAISRDIVGNIVLAAGANVIGKVGIDQTTDGTTNKVAADLRFAGTPAATGAGATTAATQRTTLASDSPGIIATGTAGSPSATVLSTQGVVGGTPAPTLPTLTAAASGLTKSRVNAAASTNATPLKASAGNIASIDVFNNAAYAVFLKLYNKASAPTVGTDTPVKTIPIAAGGGYSREWMRGNSFATGIAYAITKLQADSDTTVVVAGDLTGEIEWI